MCNYLTTGPAVRARPAPPPTGAPTRAARAPAHHTWIVVGRRGQNAPYTRPPPPPPALLPLSLAPVSAPAALISLSCPSTAAHHALAHAPRIKKDVPARKAVAGAQPVNIEQWVNRSDRRRGTYHSVHGRNKLLSIACL